jgi:hypothetical protein
MYWRSLRKLGVLISYGILRPWKEKEPNKDTKRGR